MESKTAFTICRLCLEVVPEDKCEIIDVKKRNMIKAIVPEMNLNLDSNLKMCKTCSETISAWNEFRQNFLRKSHNLHAFNCEKTSPADSTVDMEYNVCYFCQNIFECMQLEDVSNTILEKCFIEMKAVLENSSFKSCSQCRQVLEDTHKFIITCTNSTQKLKEYYYTFNVTPQNVNLFEAYQFLCGSSMSADGENDLTSTVNLEDEKDEFEVVELEGDCEKMYRCKKCTYGTKHMSRLKIHLLKHRSVTDAQMFKCSECAYETKRKGNLNNHMLKHKSYKSVEMYKCQQCIFMSKYVHSFRKHMLIHKRAGEAKVYKCTECTYEAKRKHFLQKHVLTHSKVTSEKCSPETKREAPLANPILVPVVPAMVPVVPVLSCYLWAGNSYYLLPQYQ